MNPHQSGPRTVSRSHNKKPIDPWNPSRNPRPANSRKDDHIKTLTESKFRLVATCTPVWTVEVVELQLFAKFFLKVGNPFWGGFWNEKLEAMQLFFVCFGRFRWKDEIRGQPQGLAKGKVFLIYMHCAWHCPTYTCTHFCKPKKSGWCLSKMSKQL